MHAWKSPGLLPFAFVCWASTKSFRHCCWFAGGRLAHVLPTITPAAARSREGRNGCGELCDVNEVSCNNDPAAWDWWNCRLLRGVHELLALVALERSFIASATHLLCSSFQEQVPALGAEPACRDEKAPLGDTGETSLLCAIEKL